MNLVCKNHAPLRPATLHCYSELYCSGVVHRGHFLSPLCKHDCSILSFFMVGWLPNKIELKFRLTVFMLRIIRDYVANHSRLLQLALPTYTRPRTQMRARRGARWFSGCVAY